MDPFDSLRDLLGNGSRPKPEPDADHEERAKRLDGGQIVAEGEEQIAIEVPEDSDVDAEQIEAALSGRAGSVEVRGQAGGDTTVTPVASGSDIHITDSAFDLSNWEYKAHLDDQITNLMDNRVDYNQTTGEWILANDDLIPGILIRLKSLMMGQDGLEVSPADPDTEADQRLADHMKKIYRGDQAVEAHVDPSKVIDRILEQNVMNAVFVGRSTDLQHLDVDDLSYVKDGETGEEIYIQQPTSYTTFEIDEDGDPTVGYDYKEDSTALEIGKEVVDVRLYRTPPLQAIADDVVNKMQLKRLQGRKAEIASIGGIIIKVNPPAWLAEEDYDQYVDAGDDQFGDESGRLLELVMAQQIDAALETLQDYQTATVMSIPENWETDTIDLPEMDESMSDMIRDYNEAISRRLLLPLDMIELESGPELSRDAMMRMFLDQISGWQGQITDLFDQFAKVQADIHGMAGEVEHQLPQIEAQDEKEILNLFNFAGLLGLSESEGRELANILEGVDLDTDPTRDMPQEGGPEDPEDREQQMQEFLDQQPGGQNTEPPENGQNQGPAPGDEGDEPQGAAAGSPFEAALSDEGAIKAGQEGDPICWVCGEAASLVNETPPNEFTCDYHGISPNHVPIEEADIEAADIPEGSIRFGNVGGDPFGDADVLESFVGELLQAGADEVWIGNEPWPDHSGIHDRPVAASGLSMEQAQEVWGGFESDAYALMGPKQIEAASSYSEGEEVDTPAGQGVVVEVRTEDFDGPDGAVEASEDNPAYIVGVEDGVRVYRGSDLSDGEIDADVDDPEGDLAAAKAAVASDPEAAPDWITAARGDGRFSYPDSWEESSTPARLILLKAWAGMNGQFDCPSGDCCHGTMVKNGMSPGAADRFCASMKDRVMGGWEGWRRGGGSKAYIEASHGFSGYESMREAAAHVRGLIEKQTPQGHTTEMRKRKDLDDDAFAIIVRDRQGNFQGSLLVRQSETDSEQWKVIGGEDYALVAEASEPDVHRLLAEDMTDWDPDLHPRGPDGKFIDMGAVTDILDDLPEAPRNYLDRNDIDPRVPDDAGFDDVRDAKADWQEARDNLGGLIDEYGQDGSLQIIEVLAKRRDKMRKVRSGDIGPGADADVDRPDPPEPTEALELDHISEQWDGEVPEGIPEDLGIAYAAADASENYRQFRTTVTQSGMMDISNRELHRFGRAFPRSEDEPLPDAANMDQAELDAIRGRDPVSAQAIEEAREGDGQITMYRAVPEEAEDVHVGDYVALNRDYVERHRENVLEGQQDTDAKILEEQVPIEDVAWQQGAADEFIYTPKEFRERFGTLEGFYQQAAGE